MARLQQPDLNKITRSCEDVPHHGWREPSSSKRDDPPLELAQAAVMTHAGSRVPKPTEIPPISR